MSDMQVNTVSAHDQELRITPEINSKISNDQPSKRRSVTSPPALEMNTLPLPKSAKKNPIRARFAGKAFESGEWSVRRPENSGQPIKASFTPGTDQNTNSIPKSIPIDIDTEKLIDEAVQSLQELNTNHSI